MAKIIFVSGGVISGVGKGIVAASVAKLMQMRGFSTTAVKIDPYINYDAGTLRPTEHGEVWVTHDGGEIDQDLGNYERFLNQNIPKQNNITTGQIYKAVIDKERSGEFLGATVQFVPHILNEIKLRITQAIAGFDVAVVELGGTVGDYENAPYLYAIKQLQKEIGPQNVAYILVSYLPVPHHLGEMKTRPTQQAVRALGQEGILPHFIVCRTPQAIDQVRKEKIQQATGVDLDHIIAAPDVATIYQVPEVFEQQKLADKLMKLLDIQQKHVPQWNTWRFAANTLVSAKNRVHVGIVGKYLDHGDFIVKDSYVSVEQAVYHAAAAHGVGAEIIWLSAQECERADHDIGEKLSSLDAVIVPGGFGTDGTEGKIKVIRYLRENNVPFLGICYGFQLAVVEFARSIGNMASAHTTEVDATTAFPVVCLLSEQRGVLAAQKLGGTMRLGAYAAQLDSSSRVCQLYTAAQRITDENDPIVLERHRHRYEVNPIFVKQLSKAGMSFSGSYTHDSGVPLMEFLELPEHRYFIGTQAHPEFTSRFEDANPLFSGLIKAALQRSK